MLRPRSAGIVFTVFTVSILQVWEHVLKDVWNHLDVSGTQPPFNDTVVNRLYINVATGNEHAA